jgi:hypothetical protein
VRDARLAEELFWEELKYLGDLTPGFVSGKAGQRFLRRFKRKIHAVDSTTIQLIASCMDWAKQRRRKAAAKCPLRLDLQSFLPRFAITDTARDADAKRAREVCAGVQEGEIVIFDKAYLDFGHLWDLEQRKVIWLTRAKENLQFEVLETYPVKPGGKVVTDEVGGVEERRFAAGLSGVDAAGDGVGRGGRRRAIDDLSDQPADLESRDDRRVVSVPVADRSVFQADEADAPVGGFSGDLGQRGTVASVDGVVGLFAVALLGLPLQLGA